MRDGQRGSHPPEPTTQRDRQRADADALRDRAWRALVDAGEPVTAPQLSDAAGITRGAALTFLTGWTAAGRVERRRPAGGNAAYADRFALPGSFVRVVVTGSRGWDDAAALAAALDRLAAEHGRRLVIVHGACPSGADALADAWCRRTGTPVERWPADWSTGRRAGFDRNSAMVASRPAACVAFLASSSPAGDTPGTRHCAAAAEAAGIPVVRHRQAAGGRPVERPPASAALTAAAHGWHVIPLRPDSKRPAFPDHPADRCTRTDPRCRDSHTGWEQRATTDETRIRRAWNARPYGVGVACGPSGLLVVDVDLPKPGTERPAEWAIDGVHDGFDVLAVLAERAGQPLPVDTYTVHTGRGGTHLYFRQPPGARLGNGAGRLGWLLDTRGQGGYVVAAGSTVDGHPYTVWDDRPPALLHGWLAALLAAPAPVTARPVEPVERVSAYLRAAVAGEVAHVAAATEGSRNHALFAAAAVLGQLVAGAGLPAELVTAELEQAAAGIGLTPAEATATIRSGLRAGARRPRQLGRGPAGRGEAA